MNQHTDNIDAVTGTASRRVIDWERIEIEYALNRMSAREIASCHGISHTIINRKAKENGWTRDIAIKVRLAADAKVAKALIKDKRGSSVATLPLVHPDAEAEVIESEAAIQAHVRMSHRKDIGRVRTVGTSLLAELEASVIDADRLAEFGELMRRPDDKGQDKLNDLYQKVISLPGRVDTMKKLAESMKIMIGLEREVHGIETLSGSDDANPLVALVKAMRRSTLPIVHQVENDDAL